MPTEIERNTDGAPSVRRRKFTKDDVLFLEESILEEQKRRERDRHDREKSWKEVDRQIAQVPDVRHKTLPTGLPDPDKAWMPEVELPLQAQTLEVLIADARRMTFPDSGSWFQSNAAMTDEYLRRVDYDTIITGDDMEVPSQINQDNANKLVEGWHEHIHRQYDFRGNWDRLHAEAFKYGTLVGRAKMVKKTLFPLTAKGVVKQEIRFPAMVPRSIRNVYLDDSKHNSMMEGAVIGPCVHEVSYRKFDDIAIAAKRGSQDPTDPNGGWRPQALKKLQEDKSGEIKQIEVEGDIMIPRKTTRAMFLPNTIATIALAHGEPVLIRLRFSGMKQNSYFSHCYDTEDLNSPYGTGPLTKAMPVQKAAVEALNRLLQWAALNTQPPLAYDPSDPFFNQYGGPRVFPGANWPTISGVVPQQIGDGAALFNLYIGFLSQYADLTGVNAPRLGAQTVSHTTAFAKDVELQRGTIRTVDYVRGVLSSPMPRWLQMEFDLGRKFRGTQTIFLREYGGFVDLQSKHLPDHVSYEVFGAGGPLEEREKLAVQLQAVQFAVQIELLKKQMGDDSEELDLTAIQKEALRRGFTDVDPFFATRPPAVPGGIADTGIVQPAVTSSSDPGLSLVEGG